MDKQAILDNNKKHQKNNLDERERKVYNRSFGLGAVTVGILCLVFSIYKALTHQPFYEYVSIITAYLATTNLYQFVMIKRIPYLITGIAAAAAAVWGGFMFFQVCDWS